LCNTRRCYAFLIISTFQPNRVSFSGCKGKHLFVCSKLFRKNFFFFFAAVTPAGLGFHRLKNCASLAKADAKVALFLSPARGCANFFGAPPYPVATSA